MGNQWTREKSMDKVITVWQREVNGEWEHNHTSDDYDELQLVPTGKFEHQTKAWAKGKWRKFKGKLTDQNEVIIDD